MLPNDGDDGNLDPPDAPPPPLPPVEPSEPERRSFILSHSAEIVAKRLPAIFLSADEVLDLDMYVSKSISVRYYLLDMSKSFKSL